MQKRISVSIVVLIVVIGGAAAAFFVLKGTPVAPPPSSNTTTNQLSNEVTNTDTNVVTNEEADNTNEAQPNTNISLNQTVTLTGRVFIKGIKTPSESYGIATDDNLEVGLGSYDSHREQFRPYIGADVTVTFSGVCRSGSADCCRTLFFYCGTIDTWEPVAK